MVPYVLILSRALVTESLKTLKLLFKSFVHFPDVVTEVYCRDLFKKTRDTKGTFHAKMGSIKDRNGMDITEAEDIKKRWQEYTG